MCITYATKSTFHGLHYNGLSATVDKISGNLFQTGLIEHTFGLSMWSDNRLHHGSNAFCTAVLARLRQNKFDSQLATLEASGKAKPLAKST